MELSKNRLEKLRKNLLSMDQSALEEKVREIREDRKLDKRPLKAKQPTVKKNKAVINLFDKLTPEQRAALLAELED